MNWFQNIPPKKSKSLQPAFTKGESNNTVIDPVLLPFLSAETSDAEEECLSDLLSGRHKELIYQILGFKYKVTLTGTNSNMTGFQDALDTLGNVYLRLIEELREFKEALKENPETKPIYYYDGFVASRTYLEYSNYMRVQGKTRLNVSLSYPLHLISGNESAGVAACVADVLPAQFTDPGDILYAQTFLAYQYHEINQLRWPQYVSYMLRLNDSVGYGLYRFIAIGIATEKEIADRLLMEVSVLHEVLDRGKSMKYADIAAHLSSSSKDLEGITADQVYGIWKAAQSRITRRINHFQQNFK